MWSMAGEMRSRTILAPRGTQTRPTLDRTRESLFNIIAAECPQAQVLDLYAGSGALALDPALAPGDWREMTEEEVALLEQEDVHA